LFLLYVFWVLMIFEVDWFLKAMTGLPFNRIPTFLAPVLGLGILTRVDRRAAYWPLMIFVSLHLAASMLAENAGLSREALKFMFYVVLLFTGSVAFLDSPSKMTVVLKVYLLSFVWFGLQGLSFGRVLWHPLLANEDSYGPLMVMSMAFTYFFALSTSSHGWRWLARGMFFVSLLGIVISFARGAAISAVAVLFYMLCRSPYRLRAFSFIAVMTIILLPIAGLFVPLDAYLQELMSSAEGDDTRMALWTLAGNVFKESPIWGVGAGNFGVVAARITPPEVAGQLWGHLYYRAVHNPHLQILAEEGLIGIAVWFAMIGSFFRWTRHLRTSDASVAWRQRGGKDIELLMIGRGLEGAMIGYLATSVFYNQLYIHWFWSLLAISYVLCHLTRPAPSGATAKSRSATAPRSLGFGG
jgi:O-antigen ligase